MKKRKWKRPYVDELYNEVYDEYREMFGYTVFYDFFTGIRTLGGSDRRTYSVDDATDAEINALMRESVEKGENVLLEKFRDKEYTFTPDPNCDY